jgi:hypothetical protein
MFSRIADGRQESIEAQVTAWFPGDDELNATPVG